MGMLPILLNFEPRKVPDANESASIWRFRLRDLPVNNVPILGLCAKSAGLRLRLRSARTAGGTLFLRKSLTLEELQEKMQAAIAHKSHF